MKMIFLSMAAMTAVVCAAPAAAQYNANTQQNGYGQNGYQNGVAADGNLQARIEQLRVRIQTGVQSGAISRTEAPALRQQLRALTQLERQYSVGGLTGSERSTLQQRLRSLRQQVRAADGGNNGQYDQYDRDDNYGQNESRIDRDNDGFDDRDYDRDGRWDDDVRNGSVNNGYDNGYQQPAQRSGLGGIVDRVLGTGGLRVGQRASGNLYAVPSEYRSQYRDTSGSYYRTDGRQIYQIDTRSKTVVRVHAMTR